MFHTELNCLTLQYSFSTEWQICSFVQSSVARSSLVRSLNSRYVIKFSSFASLSQTQASLVVVRLYCTRRGNLGKIGSPKYKNLKIEKERGREKNFLQIYIGYCSHVRLSAGTCLSRPVLGCTGAVTELHHLLIATLEGKDL